MFTIPKQAIPRVISQRRCKNLYLSSLCCKKIIFDAIRPGRTWIERVSFEVPHVYTEKDGFSPQLLKKTQSFVTFPHTLVDCMAL